MWPLFLLETVFDKFKWLGLGSLVSYLVSVGLIILFSSSLYTVIPLSAIVFVVVVITLFWWICSAFLAGLVQAVRDPYQM